jgi:2-dehydro-3-deoxygalactonokinase
MIVIDWGTTNCRAFRLASGTIQGRAAGPGILGVQPGGFPAALRSVLAPWLAAGERQVLMSGMVGSRQGWVEAPYLPCPADLAALAAAAVPVPFDGAVVRLLPGLSARDADGVPEVMRGEEVQLFGALSETGPDALVCLPGSHSKWVRLRAGRIEGFTTHLSGEAFAALRGHTILGRMMPDAPHDAEGFRRGVDRSGQGGGLLHHLFGVRALGLFGELAEAQSASFLSGLLIGHEVRAAGAADQAGGRVHVIGSPVLAALYADAIRQCGATPVIPDPDAAAAGLARLAEHVAWT